MFQKSSSATINTLAVTASGEDLGYVLAYGVHTGSSRAQAAGILFEGDAGPDADSVPGKITFQTSDLTGVQTAMIIDDGQDATFYGDVKMGGGTLALSSTAPTISSGFGTDPSITEDNGPIAFRIDVGTGAAASAGVIGLPTASTGWNCFFFQLYRLGAERTRPAP